ncbi:MAG: hypothetical protein KKC76_10470 [Proteobacteria bacterium]|nr:hypothetical protein [Pseudomonadota bacterium]MBU4295391.1 hypothetical protein [Pseudomonadota bacterium]MCG2748909.1 hypothetical protein [Desulfobulbaceae bacterium]
MKKKTLCSIAGIISSAVIAASSITALAADVDVYAEGAYTDTDLVVYIYADINTADPLVSAGVKLSYDSSKLTFASAIKNDTDWYFGTSALKHPYQDPQDTGSSVVFLCGKIDEITPTEGVTGTRKLIGKATFNRTESAAPGTSPETYFGSALELGVTRTDGGEFANFVTTGEAVLDNTASLDMSNVIIRERGDANADGTISVQDILRAKSLIGTTDFPVYSDCNDSGDISVQDILCIKSKI